MGAGGRPTATAATSGRPAGDAVAVLGEQFRAVFADAAVEVTDLRRLSGGAIRETWSFRASLGDATSRPLILRRDPPTAARTEGEMSREATAIKAAEAQLSAQIALLALRLKGML